MITEAKSTEITGRIARLKEKVISVKSTICTERARIYTKVYREHENTPVILKRAYALERTLKEMSVYIDDGELIVGNQSSALRAAPIFPEYVTSWIINELDEFDKRTGDAFIITEDQKSELKELCKWWNGKTLIEKGYSIMSPLNREIHDSGIIRAEGNLTSGDAHIAVNLEKILRIGLSGYLSEIDLAQQSLLNSDRDLSKKQDFYQSLKIGVESLQAFIGRYEKLASELSLQETDTIRKSELVKISENCRNIAQ
ncbi:MAG TPA: formate C-acetyltransferase/glycerol dehydratase family glycyl radical enzyme, partial [Bacteroidales bacterium]|nr:formate C-acetyltransferase/glycerol dehydratase family glycyl radical enzyme [Bacteroidales bacterium]HBZ21120.1 formate C-acetyltransferase/glycerol dehydratase family glycyl radical enzyme [Bacteroidales bacterium]